MVAEYESLDYQTQTVDWLTGQVIRGAACRSFNRSARPTETTGEPESRPPGRRRSDAGLAGRRCRRVRVSRTSTRWRRGPTPRQPPAGSLRSTVWRGRPEQPEHYDGLQEVGAGDRRAWLVGRWRSSDGAPGTVGRGLGCTPGTTAASGTAPDRARPPVRDRRRGAGHAPGPGLRDPDAARGRVGGTDAADPRPRPGRLPRAASYRSGTGRRPDRLRRRHCRCPDERRAVAGPHGAARPRCGVGVADLASGKRHGRQPGHRRAGAGRGPTAPARPGVIRGGPGGSRAGAAHGPGRRARPRGCAVVPGGDRGGCRVVAGRRSRPAGVGRGGRGQRWCPATGPGRGGGRSRRRVGRCRGARSAGTGTSAPVRGVLAGRVARVGAALRGRRRRGRGSRGRPGALAAGSHRRGRGARLLPAHRTARGRPGGRWRRGVAAGVRAAVCRRAQPRGRRRPGVEVPSRAACLGPARARPAGDPARRAGSRGAAVPRDHPRAPDRPTGRAGPGHDERARVLGAGGARPGRLGVRCPAAGLVDDAVGQARRPVACLHPQPTGCRRRAGAHRAGGLGRLPVGPRGR